MTQQINTISSWVWASYQSLLDKANFMLKDVQPGSLDSSLVGFLSQSSKMNPHLETKLDVEAINRDRKALAAIGGNIFLNNIQLQPTDIALYRTAVERLLEQKIDDSDSWLESPRLVLGITLGLRQTNLTESALHLRQNLTKEIEVLFQRPVESFRDNFLYALAFNTLSGEQVNRHIGKLARNVLATQQDQLSGRDSVAIIWAFRMFSKFLPITVEKELDLYVQRLIDDLPNLNVASFDAVDWAMTREVLISILARVKRSVTSRDIDMVNAVVESFQDSVLTMTNRRKGKVSIPIDDEYDVQDLMYIALKPFFTDLEREEPTPKEGGTSKRIDLVSHTSQLVIELKIVRDNKHAHEVFDELKIDIQSYHTHPACKDLYIFIYDPDNRIMSARQRESEFSGPREIRPGKSINVILKIR